MQGSYEECESLAREFMTRMLAMAQDLTAEPWTKASGTTFRARVLDLGRVVAWDHRMPVEAGWALAAYALETLTLDHPKHGRVTLAELARIETNA